MELSEFARHILLSPTLEAKLLPPPSDLSDLHRGPGKLYLAPERAPDIAFAPPRKRGKMPARAGLDDPARRAITLHHFANHELMALELFAAAILAYPEAPSPFRRGLVAILADEQRHFRLYQARMEALGLSFGAQPLNDHFWRGAADLQTPLRFVATMSLMFENGNLDFAQLYAQTFQEVGDPEAVDILNVVHDDEIRHVHFGLAWLRKLKDPAVSDWDAFTGALSFPSSPFRARGPVFDRDARVRAGFDDDFIHRLEGAIRSPGGDLR